VVASHTSTLNRRTPTRQSARRPSILLTPHPSAQGINPYQMCIIIFSVASCPCPPVPAYPYLRLCPAAKSHNPIRACPQGSRRSETLRYSGNCSWCIQCGREAAKQERRGWVRGRLEAQGREGLRRDEMLEDVVRMMREDEKDRQGRGRHDVMKRLWYGQ
jgi:hypothetical protein